MIRRLTTDDLAIMHQVMDARKTFQGEDFTDKHSALKNHLVDCRIEIPAFFFFGNFDDQTDELVSFASFNNMPIADNYNIGVSYSKPGLPRHPNGKYAQALFELRNYGTTFFHNNFMTTAWVVRPNNPRWLIDGPADIFDPTKYRRETWGIVPANTKVTDEVVQATVMLHGTLPGEQLIVKFIDLNPIPWPKPPVDTHVAEGLEPLPPPPWMPPLR